MAIAPDSASYPILGACRASGVDYALGLAYCDAATESAGVAVARAISARHGYPALVRFAGMILTAVEAGRVRCGLWSAA